MTESELISKYARAGIVKGSLRKGRGAHANKNVCDIKCRKCGKISKDIATSDIWLKFCKNPQCLERLNPTKKSRAK